MPGNEKQTRLQRINQQLKLAGWDVNNPDQVQQEFSISTQPGQLDEPEVQYGNRQIADYVLLDSYGQPIAVVEAKRSSRNPNEGKEQARQYAAHLQQTHGGPMPYVFYTNGEETWFWDTDNYPPLPIFGYPTLNDLERYRHLYHERQPLNHQLINTKIAGRPYQIKAIRSILEAIENKRRKFLLVMATGTGKTRTCAALIDVLVRFGWCSRVLFLVDRIALRDQARDAFAEHLPNLPIWPRHNETELATDRRIYLATHNTMLNIVQEEKPALSPHFFDLVVIDESHRSIYNTYQGILRYFHALQLGLTATPTDAIDHNTFEVFACENEQPTFAYSYEEAVEDNPPYLCNFSVTSLRTRFQVEGINPGTISLADQKRMLAEGKDVEEYRFEGSELEQTVTNTGTNALIIREFMEECIKDPNGVLPGKTIFFCISKQHAWRVMEVINALYPEHKGQLAQVLVSGDEHVHGRGGLLHQFTHNDMPRIAISVDLMDTGIDVREVVNLVFAKPVYSYTKFWQMIGRGTRLLDPARLKPWCPEKDNFLIMDCWGNTEYFKLNPEGRKPVNTRSLPERLFLLYIDKWETAAPQQPAIAAHTALHLQRMVQQLPAQSILVKEQAPLLAQLHDDFWALLDADKTALLRSHIAPLLRALSQVDFKQMLFEKDVQELSLALLRNNRQRTDVLLAAMAELMNELPLNVEIVAEQKSWIDKAATAAFWQQASEAELDELVARVGPLMKYRQPIGEGGMVQLHLRDQLLRKETVLFGPAHERLSTARYREMAETAIQQLALQHPLLQKIKSNQPLTDTELQELASELAAQSPYITEPLLQQVYDNRSASFLRLLRHILGLETVSSFTQEVNTAFNTFIAAHSNYSVMQLRFIELIRAYLLEKGRIEPADLVNLPFTQLHSSGILGLFNSRQANEIMNFTQKITA